MLSKGGASSISKLFLYLVSVCRTPPSYWTFNVCRRWSYTRRSPKPILSLVHGAIRSYDRKQRIARVGNPARIHYVPVCKEYNFYVFIFIYLLF